MSVAKKSISPEDFVASWMKAYQEHRSVSKLAAELGISRQAAYQRSAQYRSKGVKLPYLNNVGAGRRLDIDKLNQLVEK